MSTPPRLHRQEENESYSFISPIINIIEAWCLRHALLCLFICMAFLIALFTCLIFAITGVSATDSGTYYNHMQGVI